MLSNSNKLLSFISLYAGRTGGLILSFIFLPLFQSELGVEDFGLLTLYTTITALAVSLDLGISTLYSRMAASGDFHNQEGYRKYLSSEIFFLILYIIFIFIVFLSVPAKYNIFVFFGGVNLWLAIFQNVLILIYTGSKKYQFSGMIQVVVSVMKTLFSYLLIMLEPNVDSYILGQLIASLLVYFFTRKLLFNGGLIFYGNSFYSMFNLFIEQCKVGIPILITALMGVLVMQLDKIFIGYFIGLELQGYYFLALTISLLPIVVFSSPIFLFFQPKIIEAIKCEQNLYLKNYILQFNLFNFIFSIFPSMLIWFYRDELVGLWLKDEIAIGFVTKYITYMLPGAAIGSIGYLCVSFLVGFGMFKYQAKSSFLMTIVVLILLVFFSYQRDILSICVVYSLYHVVSVFVSCFGMALSQASIAFVRPILFFTIIQIILFLLVIYSNIEVFYV